MLFSNRIYYQPRSSSEKPILQWCYRWVVFIVEATAVKSQGRKLSNKTWFIANSAHYHLRKWLQSEEQIVAFVFCKCLNRYLTRILQNWLCRQDDTVHCQKTKVNTARCLVINDVKDSLLKDSVSVFKLYFFVAAQIAQVAWPIRSIGWTNFAVRVTVKKQPQSVAIPTDYCIGSIEIRSWNKGNGSLSHASSSSLDNSCNNGHHYVVGLDLLHLHRDTKAKVTLSLYGFLVRKKSDFSYWGHFPGDTYLEPEPMGLQAFVCRVVDTKLALFIIVDILWITCLNMHLHIQHVCYERKCGPLKCSPLWWTCEMSVFVELRQFPELWIHITRTPLGFVISKMCVCKPI